jgi:hypothetical protein
MNTEECETFWAKIFVGCRPGYGKLLYWEWDEKKREAHRLCQEYCDEVGLCVTITDTKFIYKDGDEPGIIVGLINYPRFPDSEQNIRNLSMNLANKLMIELKQNRVSVMFPDRTVMLTNTSK